MKKASTVLVLIPNDVPAISTAVGRLLEPFYMWRESPTHKQYLDMLTLQNLANQYELPVSDLEALAASLKQQYGVEWCIDEKGLYHTTTQNPEGKWENWSFDPASDIWPVSAILKNHTVIFVGPQSTTIRNVHPTGAVTPDGQWHDLNVENESDKVQPRSTHQQAYDIVAQYPTHLVVAVDYE